MHAPRTPLHRDGDVRKTPRVRYSRTSKPARPHLCAGGCGGHSAFGYHLCAGGPGGTTVSFRMHDGDASRRRQRFTTATLRVAVQDSQRRRFASLSEIHDGDAKIWTVIRSAYGVPYGFAYGRFCMYTCIKVKNDRP